MKITLIVLQSLDGIIACGKDDNLSWGSAEDKNFFRSKTKEIGTMIMGSSTFEAMPAKAFSDRRSLVFTSTPEKYKDYTNEFGQVEFFKGTAKEGVKYLEEQGITNAALIGGGHINGQFIDAGLVNEIYVTIAPWIFGNGTMGYGKESKKVQMKLLEVSKITDQEILLHYEVIITRSKLHS